MKLEELKTEIEELSKARAKAGADYTKSKKEVIEKLESLKAEREEALTNESNDKFIEVNGLISINEAKLNRLDNTRIKPMSLEDNKELVNKALSIVAPVANAHTKKAIEYLNKVEEEFKSMVSAYNDELVAVLDSIKALNGTEYEKAISEYYVNIDNLVAPYEVSEVERGLEKLKARNGLVEMINRLTLPTEY